MITMSPESPGSEPRILLGHLGSRGDVLYATAVARQIKHDYPGCRLTWAIGSMCREIIQDSPYVDEIWEFDMNSHPDTIQAWELFFKQAKERLASGDFDKAFYTQIYPDNFKNYDGTVRASIFRGYPGPITVPVEPFLSLNSSQIGHVQSFVKEHALEKYNPVILFEFSSYSGQSYLSEEFALATAGKILERMPHAAVILSSHQKIDSENANSERIIDASTLSFKENAELTKYCDLLIGCSSGLTWLTTSNWANKLPTIQLLKKETSVYASMVHDHEYFGLPTDHIIEMTEHEPDYVVDCVIDIFNHDFQHAKVKYHETLPLDFDFYVTLMGFVIKRRRYSHVFLSLWNVVRRYGLRWKLFTAFFRLIPLATNHLHSRRQSG